MPPTAAHRQPKTVRFVSSRPAVVLTGFVVGALPGLVLLAGHFVDVGDTVSTIVLPAAFAIALLALPVAAWAASRRDHPTLAVWALIGVALGIAASLAIWILLLAMAAGSFSFMPGRVGRRVGPLYGWRGCHAVSPSIAVACQRHAQDVG